jgi:hypoxanthine-guanine phosphoribosyltransferase
MAIIDISFPEYVNTTSFEQILLKNLPATRRKSTERVIFDFSEVQWCEQFELTLLVIWIDELRKRRKEVKFIYPLYEQIQTDSQQKDEERKLRRGLTCAYLNRWKFDDFLRKNSVQIEGHDQSYPVWADNPEQNSILPLRFFSDEANFKSFLSNLKVSKQFSLLFKDTVSLAVIGSGGIRDTIINEVGQNIYDHAGGKCGFITIGTVPSRTETNMISARYHRAPDLEKPFFLSLGKSGYMQVIIGDRGSGIAHTLIDAYKADQHVPESERQNPTESAVINYAFNLDTTSKSKELIPFEEDVDPGRGLYWVRELVRRNKGLLSVRSSSSIVRYDFLNSQDRYNYRSSADTQDTARLAKLGGTQIKIYFPINPELITPSVAQSPVKLFTGKGTAAEHRRFKVLEVSRYFDASGRWTDGKTEALLNDLLPALRKSGESSITILDFDGTALGKDILYPLLIKLARSQHEGITLVGVNIKRDPQIFDIASDVLTENIEGHTLKLRPLLFLKDSGVEILGLSSRDRSVFGEVFSTGPTPTWRGGEKAYDNFITDNDHLFVLDPSTGRPALKIDPAEVKRQLSRHYQGDLQQVIMNHTNGIFYRGKFLIPSVAYVNGYFRITALLSSDANRRKVQFIFMNKLQGLDVPPDCVITTSDELAELGNSLAVKLSRLQSRDITHLHLKDARNGDVTAGQLLTLKGKNVTIINSVVGTGRSLEAVLGICREPNYQINVSSVLSIVDARDVERARQAGIDIQVSVFEYKGQLYSLDTILHHPLRFYYDQRPQGWRVDDIQRINPKTNAPEPLDLQPAVSPLWDPVDDFFFRNIIQNTRALNVGHYTRQHRHYVYFFDMAKVAGSIGPEIAAKIYKDVSDICETSSDDSPEVPYIVFDASNRGTKSAADSIALQFETSIPKSIQELKKSEQGIVDKITGKDVVIYENTLSSGSHLQRLIDSVSEFRPRRIFAYTVIQRRDSDSVRFYQKVDSYDGIQLRIRYFVEIEIPPFTMWDCPVCKRASELEEVRELCDDALLKDFIQDEIDAIQFTSVDYATVVAEPIQAENEELVSQAILRRLVGKGKTSHFPRYTLNDLIKEFISDPAGKADDALRLLEVIAREISLLKTYDELFYENFLDRIGEACILLLQDPRDEFQREKSALITLRHLAPEKLVNDIVPIFKGTSRKRHLTLYFFTELLALLKNGRANVEAVAEGLGLCQQAVEQDRHFAVLTIEDLSLIEHLVNYVRRRLRIEKYRVEVGNQPLKAVERLWKAFVGQPGRVHPKLIQDFPKTIGIYSVERFREAFTIYHSPGGFSDSVEQLLPYFDLLVDCLRPAVRNDLKYFLSKGEGTFTGDYEILDNSLRTLATLDSQGRLREEFFEDVFYKNAAVNSAIERLKKYAFEEKGSLIRQTLMGKFTEISSVIRKLLDKCQGLFTSKGIEVRYTERRGEVLIPEEVITDVIDGFLQNILHYAFVNNFTSKVTIIAVDQEVGDVVVRICDTGKGIAEKTLAERVDGGIRRSQSILALYGGSVTLQQPTPELGAEGVKTVVEIRLLSKEKVLWSSN